MWCCLFGCGRVTRPQVVFRTGASSLPRQIGADVAGQASGLEGDDLCGEPESPGLQLALPEFKEFPRETGQRFGPTLLADIDASPAVRAPCDWKLADQDVVFTVLGSPTDAAHDQIDELRRQLARVERLLLLYHLLLDRLAVPRLFGNPVLYLSLNDAADVPSRG